MKQRVYLYETRMWLSLNETSMWLSIYHQSHLFVDIFVLLFWLYFMVFMFLKCLRSTGIDFAYINKKGRMFASIKKNN
jgi:hypothetical protein